MPPAFWHRSRWIDVAGKSPAGYDFRMVYYNSDGCESTMCSNGGRCITAFSKSLGLIATIADFVAIDGPHTAKICDNGMISLQMNDVQEVGGHK